MTEIKIKLDDCIGCKICFQACFADVIRWDEEKKQPVVKYPEECAVCTWCEIRCPKHCIDVIPDYTTKNPEIYPAEIFQRV